jgi:hypothetical protein
MPIAANPDGVLDIENATLRSREIATLSNFVAGNDEIRSSGAPVVEVYGDPANVGGLLPTLELVSNTESVTGTSFTRFTSNAGVFTIQSGTGGDADSKGDIAFSSVGGDTEHMRIQGSTGNVGIGTTSPLNKLDVMTSAGGTGLYIRGSTYGTNNEATHIRIGAGGGAANAHHAMITGGHTTAGSSYLTFSTIADFNTHGFNPAERMRIDNVGQVGIGTDAPGGTLHVKAENRVHITQGTVPAFTGLAASTGVTGRGQLVLNSMYSDLVIASTQTNNNHGSTLSFAAVNPNNTAEYRKFVIGQGNWGLRMSYLDFGFSNSNQTNPHAIINATDTVLTLDGINKRVGVGIMNPGYTLDVRYGNCNARSYKANANNGYTWSFGVGQSEYYIYGGSNGSTGVYLPWNQTYWSGNSDIRIKKNILPVENGLSKIRKINPVLYHFKTDEDTDNKRIGFIAQEWLEQQPECVSLNPSQDVLGLSMDSTIPVLFTATKELDSNQQVIQEVVNNLSDFTGQHRCLMKDISPNDYPKYEGLIVSATNNEYLNHDTTTKPTINEALPIVSLTVKEKDKACLGVISLKADPESNLPDDPTRIKVNSLGEGGIWVINTNGSLESGDYITSSNVSGYGQQQGSEFLTNYTVAKITQDCDFTIKTHKIKKLAKELKDITYYKFTYKVNITKDEYDVTDESLRLVEDYEYYCRKEIRNINETSPPSLYEADAYERIDDIQTVSKEEYDQNQSLYDKKTEYKNKDSDEIAAINEEQYNLDPSKYDVEVTYTTKSKHLSKEEYDKNSSLYKVIKVKIYENKCDKHEFDALEDDNKHEFKLIMSKKYYKLDKQETTKPHPGYETEVRQELVNVLDENGQLTWYETDETETEYDTRYLTSDGTQTDEANVVYKAAFVGCTYHCG